MLLTAVAGFALFRPAFDTSPAGGISETLPPSPTIEINQVRIPVEIAMTDAAVKKGLSGRARLDPDQGMLFLFPVSDRYRFWMPDMHFPIDIIWIADDTVADIDADVPADFDPAAPVFYAPVKPVNRVLEVNAGFAETHGIRAGDRAIFYHIE